MKIKLLDDLHLEGQMGYHLKEQPWATFQGEDVLVLAGDIAVGVGGVVNAIEYLCQYRPNTPIVYVMGNHEVYDNKNTVEEFITNLANFYANNDLVHILNCGKVVDIQGVKFFGGALWTNFDNNDWFVRHAANKGVDDFRVIKEWNVEKCAKEFERQAAFIKYAYENTQGAKKVIVTHFLPAKACISPYWRTHGATLNGYFANGLDDWIETLQDTTWLFGHTHTVMDFKLGDTRLVCNPKGYSGELHAEHYKFDPAKLIEV